VDGYCSRAEMTRRGDPGQAGGGSLARLSLIIKMVVNDRDWMYVKTSQRKS